MASVKSYILGGATLLSALSIGYVMQYGLALPGQGAHGDDVQYELTGITPASSAVAAPRLPTDLVIVNDMSDVRLHPVAATAGLEDQGIDIGAMPFANPAAGATCDITMTATATAGAMVKVDLLAPCHASEPVTMHHQGLMFTEVLQPDGTLQITVPALARRAAFIASLADGGGASAVTDVTSLAFYDRVAVQWKGEAGLQLHAREFDAAYFTDGHIWAASAGDLGAAARGEGGFLVRLGRTDTPDSLVAEVYSFPSGTTRRIGAVRLSVEAEVTDLNCDHTVEAQTLELRGGADLRVHDLSLDMPSCTTTGDFLVLKNLVEDLSIAAR